MLSEKKRIERDLEYSSRVSLLIASGPHKSDYLKKGIEAIKFGIDAAYRIKDDQPTEEEVFEESKDLIGLI